MSVIEAFTWKHTTFLSEYHPHNSVVRDAIAPPGVDRIRVCLDLMNGEYFLHD